MNLNRRLRLEWGLNVRQSILNFRFIFGRIYYQVKDWFRCIYYYCYYRKFIKGKQTEMGKEEEGLDKRVSCFKWFYLRTLIIFHENFIHRLLCFSRLSCRFCRPASCAHAVELSVLHTWENSHAQFVQTQCSPSKMSVGNFINIKFSHLRQFASLKLRKWQASAQKT